MSVCQWARWSPHLPLTPPSLPVVFVSCVDTAGKVNGEARRISALTGLINFLTAHALGQWSSNLNVQKAILRACWNSFWNPTPRDSDSVDLGGGHGCIFPRSSHVVASCWSERHTLRTTALEEDQEGSWHHSSSIIWFQCALSVSHLPKTPLCHLHYLGSSVSEELSWL